jgi:rod shape-determining protein MreD
LRTRTWVVAAVLVFLHLFLHVGLGVAAAAPDLFTLALLILARESHMAVAAGVGLALGLVEDALGLLAFGANAMAMALVGAAGARTRELFVGDSLVFVGSYLFIGKWARDLIHWIAVGEGNRGAGFGALALDATVGAAYVTVVGLLVAFAFGVLRRTGGVR